MEVMSDVHEISYKEYLKKEIYNDKNLSIWSKFKRKYIISSYNSIYLIRKMQKINKKNFKYKNILIYYYKNQLIKKYGIFIHEDSHIGIGLKLPHPNGIIIGKNVTIGENCTIYQQVTIGSSRVGDYLIGDKSQPTIGNDVTIFSGSKIIGAINIANSTIVGANAVITKSTEENGVYVGIPAKQLINKK